MPCGSKYCYAIFGYLILHQQSFANQDPKKCYLYSTKITDKLSIPSSNLFNQFNANQVYDKESFMVNGHIICIILSFDCN